VERRRQRATQKSASRVGKNTARPKPDGASWDLPNIASLIEHGDITVGVLRPVGCVATAADEDQSLAMLVRRRGESLLDLLVRLDQAIEKAYNEEIFTDEINAPRRRD